jgi:hypothetical protein
MLFVARGLRELVVRGLPSRLLADLAAFATAVPMLLIALYLVLQISGLTRLAVTVIGGTGFAGIIVAFSFRDIAENLFASVLLSVRQPSNRDDLIDVAGYSGIVQQLNTRSTVLMTADGNHVQIPNATVYKSTIVNYSSTPLRRNDFTVGIGYDEPVARAQEIVLGVLADHPVVVGEPEPMVLVSKLAPSTVDLTAYYWFDGSIYSDIRVMSALMRLSKKALMEAAVDLPGERRELVFPGGLPAAGEEQAREPHPGGAQGRREQAVAVGDAAESSEVVTSGEGRLESEAEMPRGQARNAAPPEGGSDLLDDKN